MARIKYNADVMQHISIFESLTNAKVKDCIMNDSITFVVQENDMGKAIGRQGSNIKKIEGMVKKKIRLVEFSPDIAQFVQNLIYPVKVNEIREEGDAVNIYCPDSKTKGLLIGRDRRNLNFINMVVKRHFDAEVRVA